MAGAGNLVPKGRADVQGRGGAEGVAHRRGFRWFWEFCGLPSSRCTFRHASHGDPQHGSRMPGRSLGTEFPWSRPSDTPTGSWRPLTVDVTSTGYVPQIKPASRLNLGVEPPPGGLPKVPPSPFYVCGIKGDAEIMNTSFPDSNDARKKRRR